MFLENTPEKLPKTFEAHPCPDNSKNCAEFDSFTPFSFTPPNSGLAIFTSIHNRETLDVLTIYEVDFVNYSASKPLYQYNKIELGINNFSGTEFTSIWSLACAYHNQIYKGKKAKRLGFIVECNDSSFYLVYSIGNYSYGDNLTKQQLVNVYNQQTLDGWKIIKVDELIHDNWTQKENFLDAINHHGMYDQYGCGAMLAELDWLTLSNGQSFAVFKYRWEILLVEVINASGVVIQITREGNLDCHIFNGDYPEMPQTEYPKLLYVDDTHTDKLPYFYWIASHASSSTFSEQYNLYTVSPKDEFDYVLLDNITIRRSITRIHNTEDIRGRFINKLGKELCQRSGKIIQVNLTSGSETTLENNEGQLSHRLSTTIEGSPMTISVKNYTQNVSSAKLDDKAPLTTVSCNTK
ncbi:hypothetical protein M9194_07390 [Vibrio sp. S4M6]|uniref:hypothetical protein n=1 Tax=Vibrio sinus TaxID=2946865 RepID=UPI00202A8085|nr:hypothetical protein [Vibrio sinus]MCL9781250.1 hypothetical protein [Vibrio sinus]